MIRITDVQARHGELTNPRDLIDRLYCTDNELINETADLLEKLYHRAYRAEGRLAQAQEIDHVLATVPITELARLYIEFKDEAERLRPIVQQTGAQRSLRRQEDLELIDALINERDALLEENKVLKAQVKV